MGKVAIEVSGLVRVSSVHTSPGEMRLTTLLESQSRYCWLVVWNHGILWLSIQLGIYNHPNWLIFFRGVGIPLTRNCCLLLPSGKLRVCELEYHNFYQVNQLLLCAIFNSYVTNYQRVLNGFECQMFIPRIFHPTREKNTTNHAWYIPR